MATRDYTDEGAEITPRPRTLTRAPRVGAAGEADTDSPCGAQADARPSRAWYRERAPGSCTRFPAADCLHLFKPLAAGQLRGITWLAPVLLRLHELDQFEDAALVKAKVAALFTGFITDPDGYKIEVLARHGRFK